MWNEEKAISVGQVILGGFLFLLLSWIWASLWVPASPLF